MSTLTATCPTLLDVVRRMTPEGSIEQQIVEMQTQMNEVLEDLPFLEANGVTGHRTTIRTGLPAPTWKKLYGGVQPTKSTTIQVTDSLGNLQAYAEVDADLVDINKNAEAFRKSEDIAHLEGMNQELAQTLFYGNETTEPEAFTGLAPRYSLSTAANADNLVIVTATTTDAPTSIWLCVWSPTTGHAIYPKGTNGGWTREDKGRVTVENVDGSNGRSEMYRTHYKQFVGLSIRDWRYFVRAQFNQGELVKGAATGPDLIDIMAQMLELPPSLNIGRSAFYMNRACRSILRRQIANKVASSTLTMENVAGKRVMFFDEVPVRRCDQLTNSETRIV